MWFAEGFKISTCTKLNQNFKSCLSNFNLLSKILVNEPTVGFSVRMDCEFIFNFVR